MAKNLPSLLKWSNSKKVFEWVQREAPSLPLVDPPISATSVAVAKPLEETKVNGVDKAAEQVSWYFTVFHTRDLRLKVI